MTNPRKHGKPPFRIVVVHGGPGAPGEMALVARKLSKHFGVLEPLQTKDTIEKQVRELKEVIESFATGPVILIGWSWGAWLSFIVSANHPKLINKLILVSSGPFEHKYAEQIMPTRLSRLSKKEKEYFNFLINNLEKSDKNKAFAEIGKILSKSDSYKSISHKDEVTEVQYEIYNKVWKEASKLRKSGKLLKLGRLIKCPVIAIHGDYDPHPAEGVEKPLNKVIKNFKFIPLKHCGHHPWYEKEAREKFFKILIGELK